MTMHRRRFIGSALGAAASAAVAVNGLRASPSSDIRVAVIGFNGRGKSHIDSLGARIAALCDCDEKVLKDGADRLRKRDQTVDVYTDYRRLLERQDIDAVSIATPNHTHALIGIAALQAGKHVYVEKPVSSNIWEGRQLVAAARRFNRVVQTGTQARSSQAVKDAVAFVQSGAIGEIRHVTATCYKPRQSIGKLSQPLSIPKSVNYDLWCGPAEKRDLFRPNLHYDWHWDFNTGAGDLGNQGIHQMDIARWFLGESKLAAAVFSLGGRVGYKDAGDTPNTQVVYHAYERAPLIFEVRGLPRSERYQQKGWSENMDNYRGSQIGVIVQCEKGFVVVPGYTEVIAFDNDGQPLRQWKSPEPDHVGNWLSAIEANDSNRLNADIQEGELSSALCHAGNISYRLGKAGRRSPDHVTDAMARVKASDVLSNAIERMMGHLRANGVDVDGENVLTIGEWLRIDPTTGTFLGSDQANELAKGRYRSPFLVPDMERTAGDAG